MSHRDDREEQVAAMCREHGCSPKIAKIHFDQYVHRKWHPHPTQEFSLWWKTQHEFEAGIDEKRAFNCKSFRDRFLEEKEHGMVGL